MPPECPRKEMRAYSGVIHLHRSLNNHGSMTISETGGGTEAVLGHEDDAAQAADIALATNTCPAGQRSGWDNRKVTVDGFLVCLDVSCGTQVSYENGLFMQF